MHTSRHFGLALKIVRISACAVFLLPAVPLGALADTTAAWMGKVAYINNRHIGVSSNAQTRDFLVDANTQYLRNGEKISSKEIKDGMLVTVSYSGSALFGSTKALRVEIKTFTLPLPSGT